MGWTGTHKPPGMSLKEFFTQEFNHESETRFCKVLDCKTVKFKTSYLALELLEEGTGKRDVIGMVCLVEYSPKSYWNIRYKDMTEEMGPFERECPESILRLLTPTNLIHSGQVKEWADTWRKACWDNIHARKSFPLTKGKKFRTAEPVLFTGQYKLQDFVVVKRGRYRGLIKYQDEVAYQATSTMFKFDPHKYGPLQEIE